MCSIKSVDVEDCDVCTEVFFQEYYTQNSTKCKYHVVCLPDERAKTDKDLIQLLRKYGQYQYRLRVKGKKGWLIPNKVFPAFLDEYTTMEKGRRNIVY